MKFLYIWLAAIMPVSLFAQQVAKTTIAQNGKTVGFYEYKPVGYSTKTKYPLIIFLHGFGERGNGTTEISRIKLFGIPRNIDLGHKMAFTWNGKTDTFLVLSPQCSKVDSFWHPFYIDAMLAHAKKNLSVDTNRIFLTGLSMGGGGTWAYPSASLANAKQFAGIAPVCAPCLMSNGANIAAAKVAVYAFHALDDPDFWAPPSCTINALQAINSFNPAIKPVATLYPTGGHGIWPRAYDSLPRHQNPSLFEWFLCQDRRLAPNKHPVASAGKDTLIHSASGKANLIGTGSSDPDGTILRYLWRKVSGPSGGSINNGNTALASIVNLTGSGSYLYELNVVDNRANWKTDTVKVTVNASPVARAGADVAINLPLNFCTISGSASSDADGTISRYSWTKVSGPTTFQIVSPGSAATQIKNLIKGSYRFRLTVTDNRGGTAYDEIVIAVNGQPTAKAGADSVINLPRTSTTLNGNSSTDSDGSISAYSWSKISGPSSFVISNPTAPFTALSSLSKGVYLFRLVVTDNKGATGSDTVKITINAPPIAKAGVDSTIQLPRNYSTLRGNNSSDADGTITSYSWSKISGPASGTITSPAASVSQITNLVQGVYLFRLTVKDNLNAQSADTVKVTITAANIAHFSEEVKEYNSDAKDLLVFPQPVYDELKFRFRSPKMGYTIVRISSLNGQVIQQEVFTKQTEILRGSINVNRLAVGIYQVEIFVPGAKKAVTRITKL